MNRKICLLLLLLSLGSNISTAQNKLKIKKASLSLDGLSTLDSLNQNKDNILFNFNPVINFTEEDVKFKNILKEYGTLFVVFQSKSEEEHQVLEFKSKKDRVSVTNKYVNPEEEIEYSQSDPTLGAILTYAFKLENFSRRNELSFEEFVKIISADPEDHRIMEILYFPEILSARTIEKMETYLSVKHGISLGEKNNYIASNNDTIWDFKKNKNYSYRVTGLGRDDAFKLNQKQSSNAADSIIAIGLNTIDDTNFNNKAYMPDQTYLIWSDNNGATKLVSESDSESGISSMERKWRIRLYNEGEDKSVTTQIRVQKDQLFSHLGTDEQNPEDKRVLWLAIQKENDNIDFSNSELLRQTSEDDDYIYFDEVSWSQIDDSGNYFSFFFAEDFFADYTAASLDCDGLSNVTIEIEGGVAPFSVEINSDSGSDSLTTQSREFDISLAPGVHQLTIRDANNLILNKEVSVSSEDLLSTFLKSTYQLDNSGTAEIIPLIENKNGEELTFEWRKDDKLISNQSTLRISETGDFTLYIESESGCRFEHPFTVNSNASTNNNISIFPNPVKAYSPFTIALNLEDQSNVLIEIFNANGQLIKSRTQDKVDRLNLQETINTSGSYLVVITAGEQVTTMKIIVE